MTPPPQRTAQSPPVAVRVTFWPDRTLPWIEIWTRREQPDCDPDWAPGPYGASETAHVAPAIYPYFDLHRPQFDTQQEWLDYMTTGTTTVFKPVEKAD